VTAGNPDYSAAGPYTPGTREVEIPGTGVETLTVQVWFPSSEAGSDTVTYDDLLPGGAYTDVAPDCAETRPVLVFSHGFGAIRWQSPYLTEHLASHGWVVIAPDHAGNTFLDASDDIPTIARRRPVDLQDSFDWLIGADVDADLTGCIDASAGYAVSGHSFGGYTTYATAGAPVRDPHSDDLIVLSDDRVWAAVPLAPWDASGAIDGDTTAEISVPVMTLTGARDETTPLEMVSGLHDGITSTPRYLGVFTNAGHFSFSPVACDFGKKGDGCGDEYIDLDELTGIVNTAVMAFLEDVRGVDGAIGQLPAPSGELDWDAVE